MVAALTQQVKELQNKVDHPTPVYQLSAKQVQNRQRVCYECEKANRHTCNHCFKCGQTGHQARYCQKQGNWKGVQKPGSL